MCDLWQRRYRGLYSAVLGYVRTSDKANITLVVSVEEHCIWCEWFIKKGQNSSSVGKHRERIE
jgi:hypothetical protein